MLHNTWKDRMPLSADHVVISLNTCVYSTIDAILDDVNDIDEECNVVDGADASSLNNTCDVSQENGSIDSICV